LNPGFTKYRAEGAVLGEQAALIRETGADFNDLQKNAILNDFFASN
jgi:hypothetical protein